MKHKITLSPKSEEIKSEYDKLRAIKMEQHDSRIIIQFQSYCWKNLLPI